jgi:hypothetical protein
MQFVARILNRRLTNGEIDDITLCKTLKDKVEHSGYEICRVSGIDAGNAWDCMLGWCQCWKRYDCFEDFRENFSILGEDYSIRFETGDNGLKLWPARDPGCTVTSCLALECFGCVGCVGVGLEKAMPMRLAPKKKMENFIRNYKLVSPEGRMLEGSKSDEHHRGQVLIGEVCIAVGVICAAPYYIIRFQASK